MKQIVIAALFTAIAAISTSASAEVISMDSSLNGQQLSGGTIFPKVYNPVFSGLTGLPADYTVNSLSFSFKFSDVGDTAWKFYHDQHDDTRGKYTYNNKAEAYYRDVTATDTSYFYSGVDTAKLMFGQLVLGSGSTEGMLNVQTTKVEDSKRKELLKHCGNKGCAPAYSNVTTTYENVYKNSGKFEIAGIISDKSIIDMLLGNGELAMTLKIGGNLVLTGANLMLDYTINETPVEEPGEEPAEVPEPSSVLLAGAGLAAIAFARRRRNATAA